MTLRIFSTLAAVCLIAAFAFSQVKKPEPQPVKPLFEKSLQAIVVTTDDWNLIHGTARMVERAKPGDTWKIVGESFPIVVGRSGIGLENTCPYCSDQDYPPHKHEGDGRSPAGMYPLTFTFGNADVGSKLPFTKLDEFTECVDDTNSTFYNKIVNRMQVGNFDWKSSEKMFAVRPQYDLGVFVGYNSYPPVRGNGSCIFLHIWKDADTGTAGCTAMARENLERVVRWLDPAKNPYLVQMTREEYLSQRRSFKLPKIN